MKNLSFAFFTFGVFLTACGPMGGSQPPVQTDDVTATPQMSGDEADAMVEGADDSEEVALGIIRGTRSADPSVVLYGCTATIIGPRTAVTAAHCFHPNRAANGDRVLQVNGKKITTHFFAHPSFNGYDYDVSIGFADEDFEVTPRRLASQAYWGGATITGFGCSAANGAGYGVQRSGYVRLYDYYRNRYMLKAAGGAVACPGDSGGPIFQGGAIMGVMSRTNYTKTTYITRLDVSGNRNFIVNKAAAMKRPICGVHARGCQPKQFSQEIAAAKANLTKAKATLATQEKAHKASEALVKGWETKITTAKAQLKTIVADLAKLEVDLKKATASAAPAIKAKVDQKKKEKAAKDSEIAGLGKSLAAESTKRSALKTKLTKQKAEVARLEKLLKDMDA